MSRPEGEAEPTGNPWLVFLLGLVVAALVSGLGVAYLPNGGARSVALWLAIGVGVLMIVGGVGWSYTEIRIQERLSPPKSDRQRILMYLGMLVFVALVAISSAIISSQFLHTIWLLLVPVVLVGSWLVRRRNRPLSKRTRRQ